MKIKKLSPAKTIVLASASKLALAPGVASAAGKGGEPPADRPPLKLNQVAVPFDAIIPSFNDENFRPEESVFQEELDDFEGVGVIFEGETHEGPVRLDFVISDLWFPPGEQGLQAVDVFLAYSTGLAAFEQNDPPPGLGQPFGQPRSSRQGPVDVGGPGGPAGPVDNAGGPEGPEGPVVTQFEGPGEQGGPGGQMRPGQAYHQPGQRPGGDPEPGEGPPPPEVGAGRLCLDLSNYEIIAGVRAGPINQFLDAPTRLGQALRNPNSVTISVNLSDLSAFEPGQELYFQAAAFPAGNIDFTQAQVSECDRYLIDAVFEDEPESGSKNDPTAAMPEDGGDGGEGTGGDGDVTVPTDGKF
jgi:hypothetical protein